MVTGSDLDESRKALELAKNHRMSCSCTLSCKPIPFPNVQTAKSYHSVAGLCYATIGVHPCSAKVFDTHPGGSDVLCQELRSLAIESKEAGYATAFGEIGLDYDRLYLTDKEQQLKYFEAQLNIAVEVQLPLFLHSRAASQDFERLLEPRLSELPKKGLVHSFTGTMDEMERLVAMDLDIGVNGCSMKTEENLDVVRAIPLDRIQIETDGPWVCT